MRRTPAFWEFDTVGVETGKRAGETGVVCGTLESEFHPMGQRFSLPVASSPSEVGSKWQPFRGGVSKKIHSKLGLG